MSKPNHSATKSEIMHSNVMAATALLFSSFLLCSAHPLELRQGSADAVTCNNVHIIGIRGTGDTCNPTPGYGSYLGNLISDLLSNIPNSDAVPLDYPACGGGNNQYADSEEQGRTNLISKIGQYVTNYKNKCTNSQPRIVLVGYSQGGQVVADTLCGNSDSNALGQTFSPSNPIDPSLGQYIVAATMFADPSFDPEQPWGAGTASKTDPGGVFIRTKPNQCKTYYGRARSWCDHGDKYCDSGTGPDNLMIHHSYFANQTHYIAPARKFIQGLL